MIRIKIIDRIFTSGKGAVGMLTLFFPDFSEIRSVIIAGANKYSVQVLFGETTVPARYKKCAAGHKSCCIQDDTNATITVHGDNIDVYRIGENGILVHSYGVSEGWIKTSVPEK